MNVDVEQLKSNSNSTTTTNDTVATFTTVKTSFNDKIVVIKDRQMLTADIFTDDEMD
jgi:hypothetical protein